MQKNFLESGGKGGKPAHEYLWQTAGEHTSTPPLQGYNPPDQPYTTLGGRIVCRQCNVKSKRTGNQCRGLAMKDGAKCRYHVGADISEPKSIEGRHRCAEAKTSHGREKRKLRFVRSMAMAKFAQLDDLGRAIWLITSPKTPGG